jgi:hypothetical protein
MAADSSNPDRAERAVDPVPHTRIASPVQRGDAEALRRGELISG